MDNLRRTMHATLILGLMTFSVLDVLGQSEPPAADNNAPSPVSPSIFPGRSFSANKYARTVKVLPGGKQQFVRNDRYPVQLARDAEGRVRLQNVDPVPGCDEPAYPVPTVCPRWRVLVFDPQAQTMTHWLEGDRAAPVSAVLNLSPAQVNDAENLISAMPDNEPDLGGDGATVTTENLGEKVIEGVRATGVRTTAVLPALHSGNKTTVTTIHEIWKSEEMNLVIKIIDGNPGGEERISGLEHISLQPDSALFRSPEGYEVQYRDRPQEVGKYFDKDMNQLAGWFVSQPATLPPD